MGQAGNKATRVHFLWGTLGVRLGVIPVKAPGSWAVSVIWPQKSLGESHSRGLDLLVSASLHVLRSDRRLQSHWHCTRQPSSYRGGVWGDMTEDWPILYSRENPCFVLLEYLIQLILISCGSYVLGSHYEYQISECCLSDLRGNPGLGACEPRVNTLIHNLILCVSIGRQLI